MTANPCLERTTEMGLTEGCHEIALCKDGFWRPYLINHAASWRRMMPNYRFERSRAGSSVGQFTIGSDGGSMIDIKCLRLMASHTGVAQLHR
jgi:hypothetical protein